jgi:hypothetical protein
LKRLRRILIYFLITIVVLAIALVATVFFFRDRIISQFIKEANKQLNTPVTIGEIEVSMFEQFPKLSIVLTDVYVEDSHPEKNPLLTAAHVSFQMDAMAVWNGDYTVNGLRIRDSEVNLKIDTKGDGNYVIVKETGSEGNGSVSFELDNVSLTDTKVNYKDVSAKQDMVYSSTDLNASIESADNIYEIVANGQVTSNKIIIDGISYLGGKSFTVTSELTYDDIRKNLIIKPTRLDLNQAAFSVKGTYNWKTKNLIDLVTEGKNTDIQTILSLLPGDVSKKVEKYKSNGDVYFKAKLKGEISKRRHPSLVIDFGFTDATIFHPDYNSRIEQASMTGSFATSEVSDLRQASLVLKNIKGKLNNEDFRANFILSDFTNPEVICDFKGKVDAKALMSFYPVESIQDVSGSLTADVSLAGEIQLLKSKATAQRVETRGTIDLQNINLLYGKDKIDITNLNGNLQFNNNDLALSNVSGKLKNSDFLLNGFFKNIITFLLFEDQPIGIETDLKSDYLDVDQLFGLAFGTDSENAQQEYTFSISRNVYLNFNCDVNSLKYKRFKAKKVQGNLLVKNEVAVSRNLSFESMGGNIELSGIVDAKNHKAIDLVSTVKVNNIHVDSAFYVFENFKQDFIEHRHLKGRATAEVNMEMVLNEHLKLFPETLIADITATIKNGELNNFEPMQNLNKYLDDEGLNKLRFADLKNEIHIENQTVYIPQMEIKNNLTDLKISGTHTFDQKIDYRIATPFRRKKAKDIDAEKAIEETSPGNATLFLKITGTTDDYKIAYDTEAVRKKIANDLKNEVREFKEAFKSKRKKKEKEVEVQKDEYFDDDWQNQ